MATVDDIYALLAKRDLASLFPAYLTAKTALASTHDNATLLALHEAITESLDGLLTEMGEHGLQNGCLLGIEPQLIDVRAWVDECSASWQEVGRLRGAGVTSGPLIERYVGSWMDPIGSKDWMNRMRLSVPHHQKAEWVERIIERVKSGVS